MAKSGVARAGASSARMGGGWRKAGDGSREASEGGVVSLWELGDGIQVRFDWSVPSRKKFRNMPIKVGVFGTK